MTSQEKLNNVKAVLAEKDLEKGLIVTVDYNEFWGSGYDGEEVVREISSQTGLTVTECLFAQELSVTYLLEKQE